MDFYHGGDVAPFRLGKTSIRVTICADNESPAIHDTLVGLGARVILQPHFDCIKDSQIAGQSWDQILDVTRRDTLKRPAQIPAQRPNVFALYVDAKDPRAGFHERPRWPHPVTGRPPSSPPAAASHPKTPATTNPSSSSTLTRLFRRGGVSDPPVFPS